MTIATDIPENHRLSSKALVEFCRQINQLKLEVNSFMLLQEGAITAQFWRQPYRNNSPQLLYSLSKSFTSIAIGIAWDNGLLDINDKVISFFPEKLPRTISPNLAKMTVHHLLSMNAGHHHNIYSEVAKEQDWVKSYLSIDVEHEPGTYYQYSTHSTYMLSAIIERITGQNMLDFLIPRLFDPLEIVRPSWETCPMGITAGGMGLSILTEDIAKFGLMLLNKGVYKGKRIVSEQFLQLATREQSDNRAGAKSIDAAQGYGYQFHLCRRGCYRGDGGFGQLCFVAPNENIVIVATSSFKSMKQLQTLLDLIYEHIIDKLDDNVPLSPVCKFKLDQQLLNMHHSVPVIKPLPANLPIVKPSSYVMNDNPHGLKEITLYMKQEKLIVQTIYGDNRDNLLPFSFTEPLCTKDVFNKDLSMQLQEVITYGVWLDKRTLQLSLFYIETPYVVTYTIIFEEQTIDFQFNINVSINIPDYRVTGHLLSREELSTASDKEVKW